jgi:peptidoglycan/LPS O-acetylase OafA/YrhL
LACLAVVLVHLPLAASLGVPLYRSACSAVTVFFALSAFLLYYPWAKSNAKIDLAPYCGRRLLRIYPGYVAALALASVAWILVGKPLATTDAITHLFFIHSWSESTIRTLDPPAWSLPAEMQFYVLLPLMALAIRRRPLPFLLGAIVASALVQLLVGPHPVLWRNWPLCALPFFVGMLAAWVVANERRVPRSSALVPMATVGVIGYVLCDLLAGITLPHSMQAALPGLASQSGVLPLLANVRGVALSGLTLLLLVGAAGGSRLLAWEPLRLLGVFGYGIFLLHYPIALLLQHFWSATAANILTIPLAIVAGGLSYCYIEAPAVAFGRKVMPATRAH